MKREELLEKLDQWIRRSRRDEAPDNIIWHIDDDSAYQDIVALIKKPQITEEFLSEKAKLFVYAIMPSDVEPSRADFYVAKEFLRTLFEEMK